MLEAPASRSVTAPRQAARCPACGSGGMSIFYEVEAVPVHSCVLLPTAEAALNFPRGDIRLGFCAACGFIANVAFDPSLLDYSQDYEETQGFSPRFNAFARQLAERLIARYNLRGKSVLEIGCGKGEFLVLLCALGDNRGIGIDPSYIPERTPSEAAERITFIRDYYSDAYEHLPADFICCRHTLEHIADVGDFVRLVRRSIGERDLPVFFEVPDVLRVLRELAFWDVYHEHCSYFTLGSLARLFGSCGFEVLDLATDFDDQYLLIEGRPGNGRPARSLAAANDLGPLSDAVEFFRDRHHAKLAEWADRLGTWQAQGRRVVVWGSGSKGVAFLTGLGVSEEVACAVDINPFKQGMYMAGTAHRIVGPESLVQSPPDVVIVMNSIYVEEIRNQLDGLGVRPEIIPA